MEKPAITIKNVNEILKAMVEKYPTIVNRHLKRIYFDEKTCSFKLECWKDDKHQEYDVLTVSCHN